MSGTSWVLSFANIILDFPGQLRQIAQKKAQEMRDQQAASRETESLVRELQQEREDDIKKRFDLARSEDQYKMPSEVLDDVMAVDWNLMVNEVRIKWRQIQRTNIRNKSYELAKLGKDPLAVRGDDAPRELVDSKGNNVIMKKGQIDTLAHINWQTTDNDRYMVPDPNKANSIIQEKHKKIKALKIEEIHHNPASVPVPGATSHAPDARQPDGSPQTTQKSLQQGGKGGAEDGGQPLSALQA
eukprot:CAMPEP_0115864002 /NCGR_PEP_ID=MMETSP0287-20121206/18974_1 /TAXON_ID=412157 /ORGANISM="Chrysochromulina rotalis, Strain UIO044" /LENGTH=241 /DNA_ID=CAMNT_0003318455 /DNA_START=57 /DNA_END=782 /DNA_ORIENTATION=+